MTDLAIRQNGTPAPVTPSAAALAIGEWTANLGQAIGLAEKLVDTELVPAAFWPLPPGTQLWNIPGQNPRVPLPKEEPDSFHRRRHVAIATTAGIVYYGAELGIPWSAALTGIFIVRGRPGLYAEQMVALLKSHGHTVRLLERGRERCRIYGKHRDEADGCEFEFTIEDAIEAGYVKGKGPDKGKDKGNDKYNTNPAAMLYARCASIACRTTAPEVLKGMASLEELRDEPQPTVEAVVTTPRSTAAEILARATAPAPAPAEPVTGFAREVDLQAGATLLGADAPQPEPDPEVHRYVLPVSKHQLDLIKGVFERADLGSRATAVRDQRMLVLSHLADRPITDPRHLTNDEGRLIIDTLGAEENAARVIGEILAPTDGAEPDDVTAETNDYDPTAEADWPAGADPAGEGQ